jgi:hypothetical protein
MGEVKFLLVTAATVGADLPEIMEVLILHTRREIHRGVGCRN